MIWTVVYPKALIDIISHYFHNWFTQKRPNLCLMFNVEDILLFFVCMCLFNIQNQALSVSVT